MGQIDMSNLPLNQTTQCTLSAYNNSNLTQVTAPTGSNAIIRFFNYYNTGLTAINGLEIFTRMGDYPRVNYP